MANNKLLASDNFASGSLAAGWSAFGAVLKCQVVSGSPNVTEPNGATGTNAGQWWTALGALGNQISEVTVQTLTTEVGTVLGLSVRQQNTPTFTGYDVEIKDGTMLLRRYDSGTPTQLGTASMTVASGDVITFEAAGAVLSLYQNYKRVVYVMDTTYTTGYPGYYQGTSVAISHNQVSSWRCYSGVQQDGVWTKQGIILPITSSDPTPTSGLNTETVIYEGNAQILSGTVFKMWFGSGGFGATGNVYYAESTDGQTWTRMATPVLSGYVEPVVTKYNGTYYMYVQSATVGSSLGTILAYTSPDGITWTQQNATAIVLGSGGTWDSQFIFALKLVTVVTGTFYGLYSGTNTSGGIWSTGLATSTDGINWTKYASNPVISNYFQSGCTIQANGKWYLWAHAANQGQGQSTLTDPTESIRFYTTDFIHWTQDTHSIHHSEMVESLNAFTGQASADSIVEVGGKTYLYTLMAPGDVGVGSFYQIGLAIIPTTIANLVSFPETGFSQVATDAFTSGPGNLDANWTTPTGGTALKIVAGPYVEPTVTSTICQAVFTGSSFGAAQYSKATIQTLSGTLGQSSISLLVRASTAALTGYEGVILSPIGTSDVAAYIYKRVAGSATQIGPAITVEPVSGDVWTFSVFTGSDGFPTLLLYQNDFLVLQVQDSSSTPIVSGNPGIAAYSTVAIADAQISSWAGGNANVLPYPSTTGTGYLMMMGCGA